MSQLDIRATSRGLRLPVRVKPRASRSQILGVRAGRLEIALKAPPVDGAANRELVRLLARAFGLVRAQIRIVVGESGRNKLIELEGCERGRVEHVLSSLGSGSET